MYYYLLQACTQHVHVPVYYILSLLCTCICSETTIKRSVWAQTNRKFPNHVQSTESTLHEKQVCLNEELDKKIK